MNLYESNRPRSLDAVIGQPKACAMLRGLIERGAIGGKAFWLSGNSGIGKTTLARIIARELADEFYVAEYDSADAFLQADFDRFSDTMQCRSFGKGGRALIINEAHGLRPAIVRQMLGLLERIPSHCVIVFTTTKDGQESLFEDELDAGPLLSRCVSIQLTNQGIAQAAAPMLQRIAREAGLDGQPVDEYVKLMRRVANNIRKALVEIESGAMLKAQS